MPRTKLQTLLQNVAPAGDFAAGGAILLLTTSPSSAAAGSAAHESIFDSTRGSGGAGAGAGAGASVSATALPLPRIIVSAGAEEKEEEDVVRLQFPLSPDQIARVVAAGAAKRAGVGRGTETVTNLDVRRCWHVLPGSLAIDNADQWNAKVMLPLLEKVQRALGCEQWSVTADLYKLLVYEPGCFFSRHRDNERLDGTFGTLVIQLPSQYTGATLTVSDPVDLATAVKTFDFSCGGGASPGMFASIVLPLATAAPHPLQCLPRTKGFGAPVPAAADSSERVAKKASITEWTPRV
jgi:hypothetical protein